MMSMSSDGHGPRALTKIIINLGSIFIVSNPRQKLFVTRVSICEFFILLLRHFENWTVILGFLKRGVHVVVTRRRLVFHFLNFYQPGFGFFLFRFFPDNCSFIFFVNHFVSFIVFVTRGYSSLPFGCFNESTNFV